MDESLRGSNQRFPCSIAHGRQRVLVQEHMSEAAHFMTLRKQSQRGREQGKIHSAKTHPLIRSPTIFYPQEGSERLPTFILTPLSTTSLSLCYSLEFKCFLKSNSLVLIHGAIRR